MFSLSRARTQLNTSNFCFLLNWYPMPHADVRQETHRVIPRYVLLLHSDVGCLTFLLLSFFSSNYFDPRPICSFVILQLHVCAVSGSLFISLCVPFFQQCLISAPGASFDFRCVPCTHMSSHMSWLLLLPVQSSCSLRDPPHVFLLL